MSDFSPLFMSSEEIWKKIFKERVYLSKISPGNAVIMIIKGLPASPRLEKVTMETFLGGFKLSLFDHAFILKSAAAFKQHLEPNISTNRLQQDVIRQQLITFISQQNI